MHITDSFFGGEDENALGWIAVLFIILNCITMPRVVQCNCNLMQCRYFTDVQRVASFRWPDCIGLYSVVLHCTASSVAVRCSPEMGRWYRWEDGWEQSWRENKKTKQICPGNDRRIFSSPTFADFLKFNFKM